MTVLDEPRTAHDETAREEATRTQQTTARRRFAITPVTALTALVALAAVAALFFGARWVLALTDDGLELAAQREAVLVDARQAAINLNTLDYRDVATGLDLWEQTSTGTLLEEFRANRAGYEQVITSYRRATEAEVKDAAVAELDVRAGIARVIAAVDVTVRPEGQDPVVNRQRLQLEMTRTDQGWKASRLSLLPTPSS
jgi:Mce-associated membrane protein